MARTLLLGRVFRVRKLGSLEALILANFSPDQLSPGNCGRDAVISILTATRGCESFVAQASLAMDYGDSRIVASRFFQ